LGGVDKMIQRSRTLIVHKNGDVKGVVKEEFSGPIRDRYDSESEDQKDNADTRGDNERDVIWECMSIRRTEWEGFRIVRM